MNFETLLVLCILGAVAAILGLFVWPLVKDSWLMKKALWIVHQMEETWGGGTGALKFDNAVKAFQTWINGLGFIRKLGWNINVELIKQLITAAVGQLHAEQGITPGLKQ